MAIPQAERALNQKEEIMKLTVIMGSRNPEGQTATAAKAFLQGVTEAESQSEIFFLPEMNIERCRQCEVNGWGECKSKGACIIEDDFASLAGKIRESDAVLFANPVYFQDLSESMRAFLDRLRRECRNPEGAKGVSGKKAVGICVAGGTGNGAPACAVSLEKVLTTCGFDVVDMIPARRQNLKMKQEALKIAGKWFATEGWSQK
jgi:multimeric flavodoxin WrbA